MIDTAVEYIFRKMITYSDNLWDSKSCCTLPVLTGNYLLTTMEVRIYSKYLSLFSFWKMNTRIVPWIFFRPFLFHRIRYSLAASTSERSRKDSHTRTHTYCDHQCKINSCWAEVYEMHIIEIWDCGSINNTRNIC